MMIMIYVFIGFRFYRNIVDTRPLHENSLRRIKKKTVTHAHKMIVTIVFIGYRFYRKIVETIPIHENSLRRIEKQG